VKEPQDPGHAFRRREATYPGLLRHNRRSRSSRAEEGRGGEKFAGRRRSPAGSALDAGIPCTEISDLRFPVELVPPGTRAPVRSPVRSNTEWGDLRVGDLAGSRTRSVSYREPGTERRASIIFLLPVGEDEVAVPGEVAQVEAEGGDRLRFLPHRVGRRSAPCWRGATRDFPWWRRRWPARETKDVPIHPVFHVGPHTHPPG